MRIFCRPKRPKSVSKYLTVYCLIISIYQASRKLIAYFGVYDKIPTYEKTHRKHHHGLAHGVESASPIDTADIGVILRALSAARTQRYDRWHSGKKDKQCK